MTKEIILTYCPSESERDRICGHTFEVMDYFLLLREVGYINTKILIQDNIEKKLIFKAWEDKYNLPKDYKKNIKFSKSKVVLSKHTLIFVDGMYDYYWDRYKLVYKKLILFKCNPSTPHINILNDPKILLLQDFRIYKDNQNLSNCIDYIKKINFKYFKNIKKSKQNKTLVYINSNLRKIPNNIEKEKEKYLVITGDSQPDKSYLKAPVYNLFEKFDTFLYTETTKTFDCSPRLIVECFFYNKKVIFNFNTEEYFKNDLGLKYRWYDINNNFESLFLIKDDEIIKIIKEN